MSEKSLKEKMDQLRQVKDVVFENTECCPNLIGKIKEFIKECPNDSDLGAAIRNFYLEELK